MAIDQVDRTVVTQVPSPLGEATVRRDHRRTTERVPAGPS